MRRLFRLVLSIALVLCAAESSAGQDFRGAISGRITDASTGALPGATVTATNVATNVGSNTTTDANGAYSILYLQPGNYSLSVELQGFKKLVRDGIEVRVGDRITLDLGLEVGGVEETVKVTAETPLLELGSASAGQVIDEKRIALLPLSDGNPFVLSRFVPGVAYTGDLLFSRPFDNGGTSSITADGATGGNEFTLDGSPNTANGRRVAFVPPAGAVQEFKVETANFDAADGHTAGANVNVTLKSGTNLLKGEGYYYARDESRSATDFFVNKAGREKPTLGYDRFGGLLGGPIRLPALYNGRDRTFFFGAIEWLYDEFPEPTFSTVPTEAMRNGDFSALLAQGVQIYDPLTAVQTGTTVTRTAFPGNIIPSGRISPIAREALKYIPLPNTPADSQGRNNFFLSNPRTDDFYSISTRVDHRLTDKQQIFVRYTRNDRTESRGAAFGTVNGVTPIGNFLVRKNDGITYDHVYTKSNTTLLNMRVGWQRFQEPNIRQHEGLFDPASLGFSPTTASYFQGARYFPAFDLDAFTDVGQNIGATTIHSIYSFQPTVTRIMGRHSLRAGWDLRLYHEKNSEAGAAAGSYQFRGNFTRLSSTSADLFGQDVASLVIGLPTGGSIARNALRVNDTWFNGIFVQDDWRLSNKLTINLGLRYEYEGPTTEVENRNVRGFDSNAAIAIEAAAKAAYARSPIAELPASAFNVRGGLQFATDANPGFFNADGNNFQPRVGLAYQLDSKTVLRGGVGVYTVPHIIFGTFQPGFSQSTPIVASPDNGLTFQASLFNPFPNGVLDPAGASLGPNTFLGQDVSRFVPLDWNEAQNLRYTIGIQRELPHQWLLEAGYVGSRGWDLLTGGGGAAGEIDLNAVPAQYLSTSRVRDQAVINSLATSVTNPFAGLIPGTSLNNPTVARSQLLRPYPQFLNVRTFRSDGTSRYNSAQFKIEKRFTHGYTILAGYTWSKFTERVFLLNPSDTEYENRLSEADVPHRFVVSGIWELPFGHNRRWASGANRLVDGFIGGWSVQAIGQVQSGRPISFHDRNIYFGGDLNSLKTDFTGDKNNTVFDVSGFYFHDAAVQTNGVDDPAKQRADQRIRLASNIRYFPTRVDGLRSQPLNLWDISLVKQVRLNDRFRAQFHVELLNAFNHPIFSNPNTDPTNADFGKVTSQANLPRDIQLAAKIVF
jgi:Carboxypeptidase regulatory-like domain/TonB dependent receptor-like, beta-barrel